MTKQLNITYYKVFIVNIIGRFEDMNAKDFKKISLLQDTFSVFRRKWVFSIIVDLFMGDNHFYDFKNNNPNISNQVLSKTLQYMESQDLIYKKTFDDKRRSSTEYYLTCKGKKLNKIIIEMITFTLEEEMIFDKYDENTKQEIIDNYKNILSLDD